MRSLAHGMAVVSQDVPQWKSIGRQGGEAVRAQSFKGQDRPWSVYVYRRFQRASVVLVRADGSHGASVGTRRARLALAIRSHRHGSLQVLPAVCQWPFDRAVCSEIPNALPGGVLSPIP